MTWITTAHRSWTMAQPEVEIHPPAESVWERSEEHTSELQSPDHLVCRLLLEKKKQRHGLHRTRGSRESPRARTPPGAKNTQPGERATIQVQSQFRAGRHPVPRVRLVGSARC